MELSPCNSFRRKTVSGGAFGLSVLDNNRGLDDNLTPLDFEVFPNPTTGELNVDLDNYAGKTLQLEVYSLKGQLLQSTKIEEAQSIERLNLSAYQNGMYLLKVKAEGLPDSTKRVVLSN